MLLAVDIGNTNIVFGIFKGAQLITEFRIKTDLERTSDEYGGIIELIVAQRISTPCNWTGSAVSSVVPSLTREISTAIKHVLRVEPVVIGPGVKTGIQLRVNEPTSVGADRVVNAVAASAEYGKPSIVVDFGTATSFDIVGHDGSFLGGIIAPGVNTSLNALVSRTAKLPQIELVWPEQVIGKTTVTAMQIGVVRGYALMIDGLLGEIQNELKGTLPVVATGGLGGLFAQHCKKISHYDPQLTLKGIRAVWELNRLV